MKNKVMNLQLDQEEKEILEAYEKGILEDIPLESENKNLVNAALLTMRKDKNINIRISTKDLLGLKTKALRRGLPYQTLVSSLIHQYVEDRIKAEL